MTTTITVPFSSLVTSDAINARATGKSDGIDELAASIEAKGLIQPLAVRPADSGASGKGAQRYEIIDGRRRYQAIASLVKAKKWKRDAGVPVLVRDDDDAEALETSLAANVVRLPMHQVDQHEVFARIAAGGVATGEIAARFGITERTVKQHLALGRLAPDVRAAWRKGKIDADAARAFAVNPNHDRQREVLEKLGADPYEWAIRRELAPQRVRVDQSDELALVGENAYLEAGGSIDDDLFADARYVGDLPLLMQLAGKRLQAECDRLRKKGWAWAEIEDKVSFDEYDCDHVLGDGESGTDETHVFTREQMARSGCLVSIETDFNEDGPGTVTTVHVSTGLIRPDDAGDADDQADLEEYLDDDRGGDVVAEAGSADDDESPRLSAALVETLTTQQTIVAQRVLATDPILALKALLATWQVAGGYSDGASPIRASRSGYLTTAHERPQTPKLFRSELAKLGNDIDVLARSLAPQIAAAINVCCYHASAPRDDATALIGALDGAAYLQEMRDAFNAADYFARVPKVLAIEALEEMHAGGHHFGLPGHDDLERMKKGDLAQWAGEQATSCGWLPVILRHPDYALVVAVKPEAPSRRRSGKMAAAEQSSEPESPAPAGRARKGRAAA